MNKENNHNYMQSTHNFFDKRGKVVECNEVCNYLNQIDQFYGYTARLIVKYLY